MVRNKSSNRTTAVTSARLPTKAGTVGMEQKRLNRRLWRDRKNSFSSKVGGSVRPTWGVDKRKLEAHRGPPASAKRNVHELRDEESLWLVHELPRL